MIWRVVLDWLLFLLYFLLLYLRYVSEQLASYTVVSFCYKFLSICIFDNVTQTRKIQNFTSVKFLDFKINGFNF